MKRQFCVFAYFLSALIGWAHIPCTTWKIMGPDMNGRYGGLQGRGGFDAIIPGPELFCPTIADARGNILGVYDVTHESLMWNPSRPTGYGSVSGYRPPPLGRGADLIQASAFAGIWSDVTGYYWRGNRYYDPIAGRWLSGDPLGHDSDVSLFTYAGGDPINWDDPDGLIGRATFQWMQDTGSGISRLASDAYYSVGYAGMYPFNPEAAERYYGSSARSLAGTATGLGQLAYDAAAYPSFEMLSPFIPDEAAAAYGPSLERLNVFADAMTGGSQNSDAYRTTYTLLNAAGLLLGGEFGHAGRAGRVGEVGEGLSAIERMVLSNGEILGPEGSGQFILRPGLGSQETAGVVRNGEFVNRVYDSGYAPGAGVSGPLGRSFAPGSGVPTTAAQAIQERGLNMFYPNNAQQAVVYRATQNIPATLRTSIGGTMPEVLIDPVNFSSLQRVNTFPVVSLAK